MKNRRFTLLHVIAIISLLVFGASLFQKAYTVHGYTEANTMVGYQVFIMGAFSALGGALAEWLTWLANPLFFLSVWIAFRRGRLALPFAWMAVLLAGNFLFWKNLMVNEGGGTAPFVRGSGYYCWLAAIVIWAVGWTGKAIFTGRKT